MSAYSSMYHNQRLELMARADLRGDVGCSSEPFEFLGEYVADKESGGQRKRLVEPSAEEPVRVILDVSGQHHLRGLKCFGLRSGAVESRGKR